MRRLNYKDYSNLVDYEIPLSKLAIGKSKTALDVGCGYGEGVAYLSDKGFTAIGVDFAKLSNCDVIADACDLPFSNNNFDLVLCINTLSQIPEDRKALSEAQRVLKSNGKLVLIVGNKLSFTLLGLRYSSRKAKFKWFEKTLDYYKPYTKTDLKKLLEETGFNVRSIYTAMYVPTCVSTFPKTIEEKIVGIVLRLEKIVSKIPILRSIGKEIVVIGEAKK